jgi:hypothetical protein
MTNRLTVTPDYDPATRTRSYHVTIAWPSGSTARYGFATRDAAHAAGQRMLADVPAEQPVSGQTFRVAGAGRLAGR